jgi:hypothetical protein
MSNLSSLTSAQFKRAAELKEQLEALTGELSALLGGAEVVAVSATIYETAAGPAKKKGKFSAAGLARLRAAQKARWARVHAAKGIEKPVKKARRKMSAAGRAKIAAGARARWAKVRAQKGL